MVGRVTLSLLVVFCCLQSEYAVSQAVSQENASVISDGRSQPWIEPVGFLSAPQEYGQVSSENPFVGRNGSGYVDPTTPRQPMQYATARTAEPGVGYANGPGFVTTRVGGDEDEIELTPLEKLVQRSLHRMWFRLEYLDWSLRRPGNQLLGGNTSLTGHPDIPFAVTEPISGTTGTAQVVNLSDIDLGNNNGIRGTFGIPFRSAVFEISGFAVNQADDTIQPQLGSGQFIGTTFQVNNMKSSALPRLFDDSFTARFTSSLWGVGGNIVFNTDPNPGEGFKIRPVLGFRYIGLKERLTQTGVFNAGQTIANQTSRIDAQTKNRIYGPSLGVRAELEHRWFTFGVSPSVLLAANSLETSVVSSQFLSPADPQLRTEIDRTIFTPGFQIGAYGRIHVTENFSMHVGWDFLWLTRIVRAHDSVSYNVNGVGGVPTSSAIVAKKNLGYFQAHGLSVGGELRF